METLYRIVFNGETVPGLTAQQIIAAFATRFRVREERAREIILGGNRTVLKRGLDPLKAQRYSAALKQVGLLIVLEPQPQSPTPELPASVEFNQSIDIGQSEMAEAYYDVPPSPKPAATPTPKPVAKPVAKPAPKSSPSAAAAPAVGLDADWPRCPKCRAHAVSPITGVCQSCGVVVERYLARHAERANGSDDKNPYAPPRADLTAPAIGWSGEGLRPARRVSAGRGWGWVREAWGLFRDRPWAWLGATLLYLLISIALSLVPHGIGGLAMTLIGPILTGGLMIGAHTQYQGGGFEVKQLFAGFQRNPGPLALVGAAYLGFVLLLVLVVALVGGLAAFILAGPDFMAGMDQGTFDPKQMGTLDPLFMLLAVLLFLLLGVLLGMAMLFAPALVALNEVPVLRAFKFSIQGCWRNILPFLVFGLVALALSLASLLTLGLTWLVLMPVLIIATYMAYRDIYYYR